MNVNDGFSVRVISTRMNPPIPTGSLFAPHQILPGKPASGTKPCLAAICAPGAMGVRFGSSVQGCR
jgi:hypothetical protein